MAFAVSHGRTAVGNTPLLLLPGLCCTGKLWQPLLRQLLDSSGGTNEVFIGDPHATPSLAETAAALLQQLPEAPITVVGHSLGGYLAMEMLRQDPRRIAKLGLVSTQCRADTNSIKKRHVTATRVRF